MFRGFRAPLGAILIFILGAGVAAAGSAVSSADMIAREGPGDEFRMLWTVAAGSQVDIRECNPDQWCLVVQRDKEGWVHVKRVDEAPGRKGKAGAGASPLGTIAELPGTPGSSKGGGKRMGPTADEGGIGLHDLPGNGTTGRERASKSGLFTAPDSGSSGEGNISTEAAKAPSCMRC